MVSVAYNILHAAYVNDATLRGIARVRVGLFLYLMALLFILGDRIEYWSTFLVLTLGFGAWGLLVLFLVRNRTFHGSFLLKAGGAIDQGFLVISLFALAETNLPGQTGIYLMFMLLLMDMVLVVAHFGVSTGFTIAAAANVAYVTAQSIAVGSAVWPVPIVIHVPSALIVAGITGWLVYTYRYEYRERSIELERNRRTVAAFRETAARLTLEEDPEQAMEGLVDVVRDLVNASYGALAIWDSPVTAGRWFTSGFTAEQLKAVGRMPQGRGVLGLIRDEKSALRLEDVTEHPQFGGFPPNHVPMRTFLGVPVVTKGQASGAIYVAEKESGEEFTADDEDLLQLFASLAGVLHENAELYSAVETERQIVMAIQNSMTDGLVVLNSDGRVMYRNKAIQSLSGFTDGQVMGKSMAEMKEVKPDMFADEGSHDRLMELARSAEHGPVSTDVELDLPEKKNLVVTAFPIRDDGTRMTGLLMRDVTRERNLERRRDEIVSIASHELRTPMTSILGYSELMLTKDMPENIRRDVLSRIHNASKSLTSVVDDLLNVSRIHSGTLSANLERVELGGMVEEAVRTARSLTDLHRFEVESPEDLPEVMADVDKLQQVLANLLSNAVKYSPDAGEITVGAAYEASEERVVVWVRDRGIGIASEDHESLFTTFHRIRRPETEGIRGTGMGLYIVKELVDLMNGDVWLESELGRGSTFFFSMPSDGAGAANRQNSADARDVRG